MVDSRKAFKRRKMEEISWEGVQAFSYDDGWNRGLTVLKSESSITLWVNV